VHTQSPTTIIDTAVARPSTTRRTALRTGSTLLLGGLGAEYVVTSFHAAHENPNDHNAVFAEYAASESWIAVHLGQFAAGLVVIAGILTLLRAMRPSTGPALFTRVAEGAAILTASMIAVLQGVDGFTLKHAVDSLAASPPEMHDAAFHDAEIVRWIEWAAAGYFRITLGLAVVLLSVAVVRSRALPRWSAPFALLAGLAFIADGIAVGDEGFAGGVPNLVAWASLILFAVVATVAAWWRGRRGALSDFSGRPLAASDRDRDLSLDAAGLDVPHGFRHPIQGVGPVDARGHGAGGDVVGEDR